MKTNSILRFSCAACCIVQFSLLLTSCSKEEAVLPTNDTAIRVASGAEQDPRQQDRKRFEGKTRSDIRSLDGQFDPSNSTGMKEREKDQRLEIIDNDRCRNGTCSTEKETGTALDFTPVGDRHLETGIRID